MHTTQPQSRGLQTAPSGWRRALAAGTVFALSASLLSVAIAPGSAAADVTGGTWSTAFETSDPELGSGANLGTPQNVAKQREVTQLAVQGVYSTQSPTGNEGAHRIMDPGQTKWFHGAKPSDANPIQAVYTLRSAQAVTSYQMISGGDDQPRDPKSWKVYGSNEAGAGTNLGAAWTLIDTVSNFNFGSPRWASGWFDIDSPGSYKFYKIQITDNYSSSDQFQMGSWLLYSSVPEYDSSPTSHVTRADTTAPNAGNIDQRAHRTYDQKSSTKWLTDNQDYGKPTAAKPVYLMYTLDQATAFSDYIITAGEDQAYPGQTSGVRDPGTWKMFGTNDEAAAQGFKSALPYADTVNPASASMTIPTDYLTTFTVGAQWTELDSVTNNPAFPLRRQSQVFNVDTPGAYKYVLVRFDSSVSAGDRMQFADLTLANAVPVPSAGITIKSVNSGIYESTGSAMLRYGASTTATGAGSASTVLFNDAAVAIGSHSSLTYRIRPNGPGGSNVIIDVEYTDANGANPGFFSQLANVKTTTGVAFTPEAQAESLTAGNWNNVTVDLSPLAGKVAKRVVLRFADSDATENSAISGFIGSIKVEDSRLAGSPSLADVPSPAQLRTGLADNRALGFITGGGVLNPATPITANLALNDAAGTNLPLVVTKTSSGAKLSIDPAHRPQQAGLYNGQLTGSVNGVPVSSAITLNVVADSSLTGQFKDLANLSCFAVTGTGADCDGNGYSYDRAKLAPLGYEAGHNGTVDIAGTTFNFEVPNIAVGQPDTITPAGQAWNVRLPVGATKISFIGTGNEGTKTRTVELVYTDGSREQVSVTFADWASGNLADFTSADNTVVQRPQGRLKGANDSDNLFSAVLASTPHTLAAGKTLDYIQLPPTLGNIKPDGQVHFFTFATDASVGSSVDAPVLAALTVPAKAAATPFTAELATITSAATPVTATVNWGDGSATSNGTIGAGKASGSHTYANTGTYTVTVTVTGAGKSSSTTSEIVVGKANSSVTLSGSTTSPIGAPASVTATVAPAAATGTIQWSVDGVASGSPQPLNGAQQATFDVSGLAAGAHTVVGAYSGDSVYASSVSSARTVTITKLNSSISISVSPTNVTVGGAVTLTGTVTPAVAGRLVTFTGPGNWSSTATTNASGIATATVTPATVGTASYSAAVDTNATYSSAATAAPATVTVVKKVLAAGDWSVSAPSGNVTIGGAGAVNVTLPALATGTVSFKVGSATPVVVPLNAGQASFATSSLPAGSHTITVTYSGDAFYDAPAAKTANVTVVKKITSVTLSAPAGNVAIGVDSVLTASLPTGATGTVQFKNGSENLGAPVSVSDSSAILPVSGLALGEFVITAVYSGDATHESATSDAKTFTIVKRATAVDLAASSTSVVVGASVTLTATVPSDASGTVQFKNGADDLGAPQSVTDGKAIVTLSDLPVGANSITAVYSGDSNYLASSSVSLTVTVKAAVVPVTDPTVTAVKVSRSSQVYNQKSASKRVTLSVDVAGATTGTVAFVSSKGSLGSAKIVVSGGKATAKIVVKETAAVGTYSNVRAVLTVSGKSFTSAGSAQKFAVVRAKVSSTVKITTKSFKAGSKPKVKVAISKLTNGWAADGKVQILVGKKVVKTVKISAKKNGKVTVKLPKAYAKTIKVKAKFVPKSSKTTDAKSSKTVKIVAK